MNERIRELKHQAFLWCDENIPEQYSHETGYGDAWEDKFAELLIQECISTMENAENGYRDYRNQIENGMRNHCIWLIKDKFGVE